MSLEEELVEELGSFAYDPVGFVRWAFPWGEPGELANYREPFKWQIEHLEQLGDGLRAGMPVQLAVTSGHGTGKSALTAMETWFAFSTFPGTRGVVTANTENQLKTKTWVEIAKWYRLFIARHLFKCTATALFSADETLSREWRIDVVPWSENNTEAFAGLHNLNKRLFINFDEASAIPDVIWETTEGALTDRNTEIIWSVKGNPTRNEGRFRECFPGGRFSKRWTSRVVDSRDVPNTNKEQIQAWLEDYGEDSDFFRVRVAGKFPQSSESSFIPYNLAYEAVHRPLAEPGVGPVILGVDVGGAGLNADPSVIYPRQGIDARTRTPRIYMQKGTLELSDLILRAYMEWEPAQIFIDEGFTGTAVIERCLQLSLPVVGVNFGSKPTGSNIVDPTAKYANKRAEMWGALREALSRLAIPEKVGPYELIKELTAPSAHLHRIHQTLVLESKADMRARGVPSPNVVDALALTYAYPVSATVDLPPLPATREYNPFEGV